ncbi:HesA/MoeB/ThiF family protein [Azotobacter vinelandii]
MDEYINGENVADLVSRADLVVDGAPLFEERYLMNDEAMRQGKPLCMGAMFGMEGYASTFIPGESACLRCVFPEKPEYWTDMKVFPAIGPGPAIVGTTIAMEAIKVLTGFGQPLKNILWFFDLESNTTRYLEIERVKDCPCLRGEQKPLIPGERQCRPFSCPRPSESPSRTCPDWKSGQAPSARCCGRSIRATRDSMPNCMARMAA